MLSASNKSNASADSAATSSTAPAAPRTETRPARGPVLTAPEDRVSIPQRVAYGLGGTSFQLGSNLLNQLAQPIYTITLGVNPAWIGAVQMISRLWDALIDPFIGTWSDNLRSRFGRRRPFIVIGAITTGLFFPVLWFVPRGFGTEAAFAYFLIASLIFYTLFALYSVPYQTLGLELTPDYHERTRIMVMRTFLNQLAAMAMPWVFRIVQMDVFGDTLTGARVVSVALGLVIVALGVLPGILLVERYHRLAMGQARHRYVDGLIEPFRNRPFVIVAAIVLLMGVGISTVESLGIYINIYFVAEGDKKFGATLAGWFGTATAVLSMLSAWGFSFLAGRVSKLTILRGCIVLAMIASLAAWVLYTPRLPYLQLLVPVLMAPAVTGFWIYTNSMKMDVTDHDEWRCGKRREGIFGAASAWTYKAGSSLTYFLTGGLLVVTGFDAAPGAQQDGHAVTMMRLCFTVVPFTFLAVALYLTRFFEITEEFAGQIRRDLEARRARV